MLGSRLPKNRRFSYDPIIYDPKKEEREGRKITFKRKPTKASAKVRSLTWLFILMAMVVYFIFFFSRLGK